MSKIQPCVSVVLLLRWASRASKLCLDDDSHNNNNNQKKKKKKKKSFVWMRIKKNIGHVNECS